MKKSKAETAATRKRIVDLAAKAFKSKGITATGVAEIMGAAGMTHGGFYRHFESKEQLVAEACAVSMDVMVEATQTAATSGQASLLKQLDAFLSNEARDDTTGCPLTAMGSELVRADGETRQVVTQGIDAMVQALTSVSAATSPALQREDAVFTLSALIGSLTLARIVNDPALSDQFLEVARKRLAQPAPRAARASTKTRAA